jgi:hypothetical protein
MKYKTTKLNDGNYAVAVNKNAYFTNTVCSSLEEAQKQALVQSARWYQEQIDKCAVILDDKHGVDCFEMRNYLA